MTGNRGPAQTITVGLKEVPGAAHAQSRQLSLKVHAGQCDRLRRQVLYYTRVLSKHALARRLNIFFGRMWTMSMVN